MRFFSLGGVAIALLWTANPLCYSADTEHADIKAEITKRHDEAVKRLQDWIAQVSIAAEDRGYPEGAEYMAKLARDAGFQNATVIKTDGKPGVFAHARRRCAENGRALFHVRCETVRSSRSGRRRRPKRESWTNRHLER